MPSIPLPNSHLRRILERLSSPIADPGAKLWFLKHTLEGYERRASFLRNTPLLRGLTLYYVALESLASLARRPGPPVVRPAPVFFLYRVRHAILAAILAGVGFSGYHLGRVALAGAQMGMAYLSELYAPLPPVAPPASASMGSDPGDLPSPRLDKPPEEVWQVETDAEGELWSNGLRVHTTYQTRTRARSYVRFSKNESLPIQLEEQPVGIVYHTSEYDIMPFRSGFNEEILRTSRGLLRWIAKRNLYNYFIDRFGQVYSLVIDSETASHAGMSVWADDDYLYLNLSESFIGVCFESRWKPTARVEEILTPAQIQAGLNLTDMLRCRYRIPDANCVVHGLVSVNPKKMLIGYHVDWARGFPFAALGLTNKYEVPLPAMVECGFSYDEHLLQTLQGQTWPGIKLAEIELARRAEQEGISVGDLVKQLRRRYRQKTELLKLAHVERP